MEHVNESLSDYLDGQLPEARKQAVDSHLAGCERCRAVLEELRGLSRLMTQAPQQPLPAGFMQRLHQRRAQDDADAQGRSWLPFPARVAAFALSSIVVSLLVYDQARMMRPFGRSLPAVSEDRLRLSTDDLEEGRNYQLKGLARAKGDPLIGGAAAAPDPTKGATNEELQADLEKQKARMGIRGLAPKPGPAEQAAQALRRAESLNAPAPPVVTDGAGAPQLLKSAQDAEVAAAGQPVAPSGPADAATTPLPSAPPGPKAAEGVVLNSEEERQALWQQRGLKLNPPRVNYARSSLVLVFAPDMSSAVEILGVDTRAEEVTVRYRLFERLEALAGAARREGAPIISYQFRVVPKTDKRFVFKLID